MADLLEIEGLWAGYGEAVVLSDIGFCVPDGQSLALLGRNGTGKTTLINSVVGLTTYKSGSIRLDGRDITRERPERRVAAGVGWSPQERNIFRSLTVEENLSAIARPGAWSVERVFAMFPRLEQRRDNLGSQLSGGEQQMLAIGRALIVNPRIILLDEPLEGLAPIIVDELLVVLRKVIREEIAVASYLPAIVLPWPATPSGWRCIWALPSEKVRQSNRRSSIEARHRPSKGREAYAHDHSAIPRRHGR
jgi:branched-chain amino acid transport system ATP-binding protein